MRNFKDLIVWQKGMDLAEMVYTLTQKLPNTEKYGLISQINRCAVSIPANIAEGCGRNTDKEFYQFLCISLGSSFELETDILLAIRIKQLSEEAPKEVIHLLAEVQKMLQALMAKLK